MKQPDDISLDRQLARLAPDVAPERDLWAGIEAQLSRRPRASLGRWHALAAGAAGACIASALTWAILHGHPNAPSPALVARAPDFEEPRNPRYIAARASLQASFSQRLALLDAPTRAKIEASLKVIRHAHEDIRQALLQHPESPILEQLWQSTWRDELDLYENVVQATEPTMLRI